MSFLNLEEKVGELRGKLKKAYNELLFKHGPQGWWPFVEDGEVIYHPNSYHFPKEKFEVFIGAILTQNTSWKNVEKALINLYEENLLNAEEIIKTPPQKLEDLIKSSGYYRVKAKKLKEAANFYLSLKAPPSRQALLSVWGIGKETADSILLYAYNKPFFIVDTYARRFLSSLNLIEGKEPYDRIRALVEASLEKDFRIYNEFHALIVEEMKRRVKK